MTNAVYIWDLPLRVFHWLLVATVPLSYLTGKLNGLWLEWHVKLGLFIIALIVFRIMWGFLGSTFSRFSHFFPTPRRIVHQITCRWSAPGHSPTGALSVMAMLVVILVQSISGLFASEEDIDVQGPLFELVSHSLSDSFTAWHAVLADWLAALVILHITAIAYYALVKRNNLVTPMLTGRIAVTGIEPSIPIHSTHPARLIGSVSVSALVVWLIGSGVLVQ